jgi:iron complex transport system substrate-binding protein
MDGPMRIVSLLPSATEIVCALGAGEDLVGISHECDFPSSIRDRKVLTRSRIGVDGSSKSIDTAVREVIQNALSIYAIDEQALAALQPDVIVTQDLCEVCAVSLDDVRAAVARLAHREEVRIVSLRPTRLGDILDDIDRVAAGLGLHGSAFARSSKSVFAPSPPELPRLPRGRAWRRWSGWSR